MKTKWLTAINLFNQSANDGIDYFIENKLIENNPKSIAQLLKCEYRLSRKEIGNFISDNTELSKACLNEYTLQFNVKDKELIDALREYLSLFLIPGESQKIERILMKFSSNFYLNNPNNHILTNTNIVYTIAYSIIFLMSDLHNPGGLKKFTCQKYIDVTKETLDITNFPTWYLEKIFNEVSHHKISINSFYQSEFNHGLLLESEQSNLISSFNDFSTRKLSFAEISNDVIPKIDAIELENHQNSDFILFKHIIDKNLETLDDHDNFLAFQALLFKSISGMILHHSIKLITITQNISTFDAIIGFIELIFHLGDYYQIKELKDTILSNLINLSQIIEATKYDQLTRKNLIIYSFLLKLSYKYIHSIEDQWSGILRCISTQELLEMPISSIDNQIILTISHTSTFKLWLQNQLSNTTEQFIEIEKILSRQESFRTKNFNFNNIALHDKMTIPMACIVKAIVNEIFQVIGNLPDKEILVFISCLCEIAVEETKESQTRQISLSKVFELLQTCISKGPESLKKILECTLPYLLPFITSSNINLSTFTIDCLRQLLVQIIDLDSYLTSHVQLIIFEVLAQIIQNGKCHLNTLEYLENSIVSLIKTHHDKLDLSWQPIVEIMTGLMLSDQSKNRPLSRKTFNDMTKLIMLNCMPFAHNHVLFKSLSLVLQSFLDFLYAEDDVDTAKIISDIILKILSLLFDEKKGKIEISWSNDETLSQDSKETYIWAHAFIPAIYMIAKSTFYTQVNVSTFMIDTFLLIMQKYHNLVEKNQKDIFSLIEYIFFPSQSIMSQTILATKYTQDRTRFCIDYFLSKLTQHWPKIYRCFSEIIGNLMKLLKSKLLILNDNEEKNDENLMINSFSLFEKEQKDINVESKYNTSDSKDMNAKLSIDDNNTQNFEVNSVIWQRNLELIINLLIVIGKTSNDDVDSYKNDKSNDDDSKKSLRECVLETILDIYKFYKSSSLLHHNNINNNNDIDYNEKNDNQQLIVQSSSTLKQDKDFRSQKLNSNHVGSITNTKSRNISITKQSNDSKSNAVYLLYNSMSQMIFNDSMKTLINESLNYFNSLNMTIDDLKHFHSITNRYSDQIKQFKPNFRFPEFLVDSCLAIDVLQSIKHVIEFGNSDLPSVISKKSSDELLEFILGLRLTYMIHFTLLTASYTDFINEKSSKQSNNNDDDAINCKFQAYFTELIDFVTKQLQYLLEIFVCENRLSLNRKYLKTYMMMFYTLKCFLVDKRDLIKKTRVLYRMTCQISSNCKAKAMAIACCDFLRIYEDFIA